MKAKLTVTIDRDLIPKAKQVARSRGVSLSQLIEQSFRDFDTGGKPSFSRRWKGAFRPADRVSERYRRLAAKYL